MLNTLNLSWSYRMDKSILILYLSIKNFLTFYIDYFTYIDYKFLNMCPFFY